MHVMPLDLNLPSKQHQHHQQGIDRNKAAFRSRALSDTHITASMWTKTREQRTFLARALRTTPSYSAFAAEDLLAIVEDMHCEEAAEGTLWTPSSSVAVIETGCYEDEAQCEVYMGGRIIQSPPASPSLAATTTTTTATTSLNAASPPQRPAFAFDSLVPVWPRDAETSHGNQTGGSGDLESRGDMESRGSGFSPQGFCLRVLQPGRIWVLPESTTQDYLRMRQASLRSKALTNTFPSLKSLSLDLLTHLTSLFEEHLFKQGDVILSDFFSSDTCAIIEHGSAAVHVCRPGTPSAGHAECAPGPEDGVLHGPGAAHPSEELSEELAVLGTKSVIAGMGATHGGPGGAGAGGSSRGPSGAREQARAFLCAKENNTRVAIFRKAVLESFIGSHVSPCV